MRERLGSFVRHNAIGLIALVVAMSGVAYAAAPKNSVTSKSIKDGNVKAADLGADAVNSANVADQSLGSADVAGLTSADISELTAASLDLGVHAKFNFNTTTTDTV